MDPNTDTRNVPVPAEFSDGAKEVPIIDNQNSSQEAQPQDQQQAQPQPQAQPQVQSGVPNPQVQPTIDIEAMKRQAQARRQATSGAKKREDYKTLFTKRYFLAVGILLTTAVIVFGLIIIIQF